MIHARTGGSFSLVIVSPLTLQIGKSNQMIEVALTHTQAFVRVTFVKLGL